MRAVAVVVWSGLGLLVVVLLAVSWWLDRDARRRGARPLRSGDMDRARRARDWELRREMNQVGKGMLPKTEDARRDIWRGTSS